MLRLQSKITFIPKDDRIDPNSTDAFAKLLSKELKEPIIFNFVTDVEIESSFKDLTSTAKITIPRKLKFNGRKIATEINSIFKRGDKVKIELGYFGKDLGLRTVFEGYVSTVSMSTPLVIHCEDEMLTLKRKKILWPKQLGSHHTTTKTGKVSKKVTANITKIKLKDLVNDVLLNGTTIKSKILTDVEINVKQFDSSACEVLAELHKEYGIYSYFVDGVLHCGLASDASRTDTVEYIWEEHIIDDSSLQYQRKDDLLLRVEAESIDSKTNKREKVEVGDPDGQHKKFFIQNATKAELTKFAQSKLNEEKYEGYRGSFTTFFEPFIKHGDAAKLTSKRYEEKGGTYQVVGVRYRFGVETGAKQDVQIGQRYDFK